MIFNNASAWVARDFRYESYDNTRYYNRCRLINSILYIKNTRKYMPVFPNMKCCRVESYDGREGTSEFPSLRDSEFARFDVSQWDLEISLILKTMVYDMFWGDQ